MNSRASLLILVDARASVVRGGQYVHLDQITQGLAKVLSLCVSMASFAHYVIIATDIKILE